MKVLKSGKEEIVLLLKKVIDKYTQETGQALVLNTNRKNYEAIAILLSEISKTFPEQWENLGTEPYAKDTNNKSVEYPYRKYDITGGQVKDALNGIVSNPRSFLVDACYVYLFQVGRKHFEQNPLDESLLKNTGEQLHDTNSASASSYDKLSQPNTNHAAKSSKPLQSLFIVVCLLLIGCVVWISYLLHQQHQWENMKSELNIMPYKPTKSEIDSLEGIWLCYTGSPQARISDPKRFHKVVPNLIKIDYKEGYFTYNRFGASFNHTGFMQFESPGIVSVHSKIKNNTGIVESPRHSLLNLYTNKNYVSAISASWNFDVGEKNKIIGIREIYLKLGKGGQVTEVLNDVENASCNCKVMKWQQTNGSVKKIYLRNEILDSLNLSYLKDLINENSILEHIPQDHLLLQNDSVKK